MWFQNICQMIRSCQEPPYPHLLLGGHWWFLTEDIEDRCYPGHNKLSCYVISHMCAKFQCSSIKKVCQEPPYPDWWLKGHWGLPPGHMKDMDYHWCKLCSSYVIPNLCAEFQLSSITISVSRITPTSSVTLGYWRFLTGDTDYMGHTLHNICFSYVISNLSSQVQLPSFIKSVSRITP